MIKGSSQPRSQAANTSTGRKPLSCTSCRQRKIKCNRLNPCDQCLDLGVSCVFPLRRVRASRARRDNLEARDAELLRRISHLEALLANKEGERPLTPEIVASGRSRRSTLLTPLPANGALGGAHQKAVPVDDHYAAFIKQQGNSSRYLGQEFWSNISDEFNSLRQLIEGHTDDEDGCDEASPLSTGIVDPSSSIILQDPNRLTDSELVFPPAGHSEVLFKYFFSNVDPVCKILHRPTVDTYFSNVEALVHPLTQKFKFRSLAAVTFAAYFAAVNTMSFQECLLYLGEEKTTLLARYRSNAEAALVEADFLNSLEISTLQAFVIYVVVDRSLGMGRSTWTLIGLAKRIACALGLHRDGDGLAFSAFEAEMRRRLWWQIRVLDTRASLDRGSDCGVLEADGDTKMPRNLNDQDFSYDSQHPLYDRQGPSEMTLSLLFMNALSTIRQIYSRTSSSIDGALTYPQKQQMVKQFAERVQSMCTAGADHLDPRAKMLRLIGHYWMCQLFLALYYPTQHGILSEQVQSRMQGLQVAIAVLGITESLEKDPCSRNFAWLLSTYAPWHAAAVVCAELCHQPHGVLADQSWEMVQSRVEEWNSRATDTKEVMMWASVKKLLKRASLARQRSESCVAVRQAVPPSDLDSLLRAFEFPRPLAPEQTPEQVNNFPNLYPSPYFDSSYGAPYQTSDYTTAGDYNIIPDGDTVPNPAEMLVDWNDFTFDINELGADFPPGSYTL
ncbi:MAG: hypothetical protein Q9195_002142 [Heterodermia aff. obscurata]